MKLFNLKFLFTAFILTSFFSCEPPVVFTEPQPTDIKNLADFPRRIHGKYLNQEENSIVTIREKLITKTYDYDYKFHLNQLDSNLSLLGDTFNNSKTNKKNNLIRDGDSLIAHIHFVDTLFQIGQDNIVRKYRGFYFLNTRYTNSSWEVKKVQLIKGKLIISIVTSEHDIELLKDITTPSDTFPQYKFAPTRKQFKEFIKKRGFKDQEVLLKVSM
jgi:hypothetical protein